VRVIPAAQAWKTATRKPLSESGVATPFGLGEQDRFFFFGSCLARSMERAFRIRGLTVLSTTIAFPASECALGLDVVNKVKIPAIVQELSWALGLTTFPANALLEEEGGEVWRDLQLPGEVRPASYERTLERRRDVQRYFSRIADANVVIVDLCAIDMWFDRLTDLSLNAGPSYWALRREPERFEYRLGGYATLHASLLDLRRLLGGLGHPVRMILIVNPMGLRASFRGGDVQTIEMLYRSTLRTVAGELADEFDDIAYYPLYESIAYRPRSEMFNNHDVRVREDVIDAISGSMLRAFGIDRAPSEPDYDEASYLRANPDVAARVRAGTVRSGYDHWLDEGRAAGRPLTVATAQLDDPIDTSDLRATITAGVPSQVPLNQRIELSVTIANAGNASYATTGKYPVHLCYRWYDASGAPAEVGHSLHTALPDVVLPGESVTLSARIATPRSPGHYTLALTLLQHNVAWFDDVDPANGLRAPVLVESLVPAQRTAVAVS
jgi:hypothetical protein